MLEQVVGHVMSLRKPIWRYLRVQVSGLCYVWHCAEKDQKDVGYSPLSLMTGQETQAFIWFCHGS